MNIGKQKAITTPELKIQGHLLSWPGVRIQINNISMVTTVDVPADPFPWLAILVFLFGVVFMGFNAAISIIAIIVAALWVVAWALKYKEAKNRRYLMIELNSGKVYSLIFNREIFLNEVIDVFSNIFLDDGEKSENLVTTINIETEKIDTVTVPDATFQKGSSMVNTYNDHTA